MPIPGIVASQGLLNASAPEPGDPTLMILDFINDAYEIGGNPTTLAAVIDTPERVDAQGLYIPQEEPSPTNILGVAADILLAAEWTIVLEVEELTTTDFLRFLSLCEPPMPDEDYFQVGTGVRFTAFDEDNQASDMGPRIVLGPFDSVGIHKVAVTRTPDHLAISVDGSAPVVNDNDFIALNSLTNATFGGAFGDSQFNNGNECYIRSLTVLETQDDASLQSLSV